MKPKPAAQPFPAPDVLEQMRRQLYSAVISDIMDELGLLNRIMEEGIRPLDRSMVVVGRALPVRVADAAGPPAEPYRLQLEAIDSLQPGQVMVVAVEGRHYAALWGELMSTAARARGTEGVVTDGLVRDSRKVMAMEYPVFARGCCPLDSKGRLEVIEYGSAVDCGGVRVEPGDLVFGDLDGIVAVPRASAQEVVRLALTKVAGENAVRSALAAGMSTREAFRRYGIL